MTSYLLVSTCSPAHQSKAEQIYAVAAELRDAGNDVTLLLIENGVLCARGGSAGALKELHGRGVTVIADEVSLASRGLSNARLEVGITKARIGTVVARVENERRASLN